jgi:hypothetical protein
VFHYTPKHCSWLNQIEIWFSIPVRKLIKRGSFISVEDLEAKVLGFIENYNRTMAKPFKWTYQGSRSQPKPLPYLSPNVLGGREFSLGIAPQWQTSPSMRTRVSVLRVATTWRTSRRCVPGWSGSPPCRATCHRPVKTTRAPPLVESTDTSAVERAERIPSIAHAERLARALGTTLSEMLPEVEPEVIPS